MSLDFEWKFPKYPDNWDYVRKEVKKRDNYTCQICHKKYPPNSIHLKVHHIKPLSKGGKTLPDNLITLCEMCHIKQHPHLQRIKDRNSNGPKGKRKRVDYRNKRNRKSYGYYTGKRGNTFKKKRKT